MNESTVTEAAGRARTAATDLALATRATKDAALHAMADTLLDRIEEILSANTQDVHAAESAGTPAAIKTWWYPGNSTGYEFIYPRKQALEK